MEIRNTRDRRDVLEIYRWSIAQSLRGDCQQVPHWDAGSPWHNTLFHHRASGKQWVVYLADQAWPGEVRLLDSSTAAT